MKKLFSISLALLFALSVIGVAFADGIPVAVEPKNYPTVWTQIVYNGSGSDISTGYAVVWDFDTSDSSITAYDDMCPWVKTTTTASDPWTAGVTTVDKAINNGDTGVIIIKGPAVVYDGPADGTQTADDLVGTTTTAGAVAEVTAVTNDGAFLGVCIKDSASNQGNAADPLIYVNPTLFFDD